MRAHEKRLGTFGAGGFSEPTHLTEDISQYLYFVSQELGEFYNGETKHGILLLAVRRPRFRACHVVTTKPSLWQELHSLQDRGCSANSNEVACCNVCNVVHVRLLGADVPQIFKVTYCRIPHPSWNHGPRPHLERGPRTCHPSPPQTWTNRCSRGRRGKPVDPKNWMIKGIVWYSFYMFLPSGKHTKNNGESPCY